MDIQKLLSEMLKRTSLKEKVKRKNIFFYREEGKNLFHYTM